MQKQIPSSIKNKELITERRRQIVTAATKLFITRGFDGVGLREIAKATGLTVGALYRYIESKDDIAQLTADFGNLYQREVLEEIRESVKNLTPVEALKKSILIYFGIVDKMQDLYIFRSHIVWAASKKPRQSILDRESLTVNYFNQLLMEGVNTGEFVIKDTYFTAHNIVIAANAWANRRWLLTKRFTLEDYIKKETDFILNSIQPKKVLTTRTRTAGDKQKIKVRTQK